MTLAREARCPEPLAYPPLLALSCPAFHTCEAPSGAVWIDKDSSRDALRVEALLSLHGHRATNTHEQLSRRLPIVRGCQLSLSSAKCVPCRRYAMASAHLMLVGKLLNIIACRWHRVAQSGCVRAGLKCPLS